MRIRISVDMEGISGVNSSEFVTPDARLYQEGRRYYTWDINACVRGCFNGGADAALVRDGHGGGTHAIWDKLDPRIEIVRGSSGAERMPFLKECDAQILLGFHAMAGTRGALLEHTFSSRHIQNMWLNGRPVGEIGIDAAIAAESGVPTVMVSGDDAACAEARDWIPGVVTCQVKQGISCQGARLLSREKAHRLLEEMAAEAVSKVGEIALVQVNRPVTIRSEVIERGGIPAELARPGLKVIDGRTVEVTADTVKEAFARVCG